MNLLNHFSSADWQSLATTLLHTLWQGAAIALLLTVVLRFTSTQRPNRRYGLALTALIAIVLTGFFTWAYVDYQQNAPAAASEPVTEEASANTTNEDSAASANSAQSAPAVKSLDPRRLIIPIWLLGVGVMLFRLATSLRAADSLRRSCQPANDRALTQQLDQLISKTLQREQHVRLMLADQLSSPIAMGFFWPVIILPTAVATGTAPEMLRAILAHELAHIRRHDYLVNLGQLLVETILFFNPAVWWISRQIRIEREACCDAEAARLIGDETKYAEALTDYADSRRSGIPVPALAFGQEKEGGSLSDRIRRLLVPGYQPRLRLPMQGLVMFLLISGLTLTVLHQGSRIAVAATARLLTPKERIEKIREVQTTHSIPFDRKKYDEKAAQKPESRVKISGKILDPEGKILTDDHIWVRARSERPSYSASAALNNNDGIVKDAIQPGQISLAAFSKNYAPALLGPFAGEIAGKLDALKFVMRPGFIGAIKLLDGAGKPITNALVSGKYDFGAYVGLDKRTTDHEGIARFTNLVSHPLALKVDAPGYQHSEKIFTLSPDRMAEWKLESAAVARIKIINAAGQPISGAEARLMRIKGPKSMGYGDGSRPLAGTSDKNGILTLDQLRDDSAYWFVLEAAGYRRDFLRQVFPGETDRIFTLGPPIVVSGVIEGDLRQLSKRWQGRGKKRESKPVIHYSNGYKLDSHSSDFSQPCFVRIEGGKAYFEVTNLWPGRIRITAGQERVSQKLATSITGLTLKLNPPAEVTVDGKPAPLPEREVVFRFTTPPGNPPANGKVLTVLNLKEPDGGFDYDRRGIEVKDGEARFTVPVGSKLTCEPTGFTGYWFLSPRQTEITAGSGPHVITLPCSPAGAIYGTITEADGSPAKAVLISLVEVKRANPKRMGSLDVDIKDSASSGDQTDRFTATPLPIGGTYMIVAHRGANYSVSEPLQVTRENPIHEIKMVMHQGITIKGQLLTPAGKPAGGIRYNLSFAPNTGSHSFGASDQITDRLGRFTIRNLYPNIAGSYHLSLRDNPGYQIQRVPIDPREGEMKVTVKPGHVVTGSVIDEETGWPIPGVEVFALPRPHAKDRGGYIDADGKADPNGNFQFTTMDGGRYQLGVRGAKFSSSDAPIVRGGQKKHVRIAVTLAEWSKLKPVKPTIKSVAR